jgi:hypothetical protein
MKHHHDLRSTLDHGSKEAVQTSALISDLDRIVRIIDEDIAREEKESGVFNRSNPAYSILATMLRARRNNLANTIASLERRVASLLDRTDANKIADVRHAYSCPQGRAAELAQ